MLINIIIQTGTEKKEHHQKEKGKQKPHRTTQLIPRPHPIAGVREEEEKTRGREGRDRQSYLSGVSRVSRVAGILEDS